MRIPVIEKIPFRYAVVFATTLFVAEALEGTNLEFAALVAAYICISCIAFNIAKGFVYPSGAFIFFNAVLTAIFGLTYKAFLNQPGESNLKAPITTLKMYCLTMIVMAFVAAITRRITPARSFLTAMGEGEASKEAAIGALVLGLFIQSFTYTAAESGSFLAAMRQLNFFVQVSILLATYYEVKKSHGVRSSNWIVFAGVGISVILGGVLGTSKAGFASPPLTWFLAAIFAGHTFPRKQILGILGAVVIFQVYLVPYSQVVRNFKGEQTLASNLATSRDYIFDLGGVRQIYLDDQAALDFTIESTSPHLYDQPEGFIERLNILGPDDALIAYTDEGNYEGLYPTYVAVLNIIPHFLWKDKPYYYAGNEYAREIGTISSEDETTGISFSPAADAYHQVGYYGLILIFVILLIVFVVMDAISGDQRLSPWGLVFTVLVVHDANEGMIVNQLYIPTYVAAGVVLVALANKYVLPIITRIATNSERTRVLKAPVFAAPGREARPLTSQERDSGR